MITLDLSFYWFSVGGVAAVLAGFWAFKRLKSLFTR